MTLRIVSDRRLRPLTSGEIALAVAAYGSTKSYTYKKLRNVLGISVGERFDRIGPDKEDRDFVCSSGAAAGTKMLTDLLNRAIGTIETKGLLARDEPLDAAMTVIAFNEDLDEIRKQLGKIDMPPAAANALYKAVEENRFDFVKRTGHISNVAARRLNTHLIKSLRYDEACTAEGWDHAAQRAWKLEDIKSPVAQKAAREMLKQVKVLENEYGPFDMINIEMARDIGKSIEERGKIEKGIERRTSERQKSETEVKEMLELEYVTSEDILRYELWKEQQGRCLYTGRVIDPNAICASDNSVQVDHILPFSRFGDNSFLNKTLCFTEANQQKRNRTPFEWKDTNEPDDWARFNAEVESCEAIKGIKKRNYLLMDASECEGKLRERNLNDTRFALRVILGLLRKHYPDVSDGVGKDDTKRKRRRVFARPGAITAALRRAWGVESLKKDENGKRKSDDRHHALDAIITACCSERLLQQATRHAQKLEKRGEKFELRNLAPPWGAHGQFRREIEEAIGSVFVSRPERGRLRGKAHDETIKQIRVVDGKEELFERKPIDQLKLADLDRIPIPKPYSPKNGKTVVDPKKLRDEMVENLRMWIEKKTELNSLIAKIKGKSEEKTALQKALKTLTSPLSPKGDPVKKVRLKTNNKKAMEVRGGNADRADMVRVDVFTKPTNNGDVRFYLVPIYRNDVYNNDEFLKSNPPIRAVAQSKPEKDWPIMDQSFQFCFSLSSFSLIEIIRSDGEIIRGYFRGLDRSKGAITLSNPEDSSRLRRGIGARLLHSFKKFHVDRLGNINEIKRETRTWRGKACT